MKLRPSPILEHGVVSAAGPMLVFSLYLLLAGHNQPGGGFAGGLVAGVTVVLAWSAGGPSTVRRIIPVRASALLGLGLVIAASSGFVSLLSGGGFLESGYVTADVPLIGAIKLVSALGFDIGVYLVVVGMAVGLVRSLGEDASEEVSSS